MPTNIAAIGRALYAAIKQAFKSTVRATKCSAVNAANGYSQQSTLVTAHGGSVGPTCIYPYYATLL